LKIPVWIFTEFKSESHYSNCGHPHPSLPLSLYLTKLGEFLNQKKERKSKIIEKTMNHLTVKVTVILKLRMMMMKKMKSTFQSIANLFQKYFHQNIWIKR
jgi:hypothetical protein